MSNPPHTEGVNPEVGSVDALAPVLLSQAAFDGLTDEVVTLRKAIKGHLTELALLARVVDAVRTHTDWHPHQSRSAIISALEALDNSGFPSSGTTSADYFWGDDKPLGLHP